MRDNSVSIAKAIAIILMVLAHARCPILWQHYINMFHMPLFFFFSGYCFKEFYITEPSKFLVKRVNGIWKPYVKWSIFFLLLHNVFFSLHIYDVNVTYRGFVEYPYTFEDMVKHTIKILITMSGHDQLLGGYWFMHSLFLGSIIFIVVVFCAKRMGCNYKMGGAFLLLTALSLFYYNMQIPFLSIGGREFHAAFFIWIGYRYQSSKYKIERNNGFISAILFLCGLLFVGIGTKYWQCSMLSMTTITIIPYSVTAVAGIFSVFIFSRVINTYQSIANFLCFIGDNTLSILTWHFLSFKIISLFIIKLYSIPISRLAEFPVIEEYAYQGWFMLYFFAGVCIPILTICLTKRICSMN